MAKRSRWQGSPTTSRSGGDLLEELERKLKKQRRYIRNPKAAERRAWDAMNIDPEDMTMGGDIDPGIIELLKKITPPDNERKANVNRQARLAKVAQALAPPPERIPPQKGVSLPRVPRDERAASIAAERFDPRTEEFRRLAERGGLSSSQRTPGEPSIVAEEAQVTEEGGGGTDMIQKVIEQIKSQVDRHPEGSKKRIADAQRAYDEQTKRMKELAGARPGIDSVMDEPVIGEWIDSQMDEPVMDDSVSVESFMDEPVMDYDTDIVMSPDDLEVDSSFEISPSHRGATTVVSQMMDIEDERVDRTTDETKSSSGLHRKHQQEDSGSSVSVNPVKKMEESWYDAEGNKTNRLGRTIDNFIRGMFGGEEHPGETSPFGILSKASMEGYEDKPWFAEGGMVRKKYRKGGSVKFNSGGTVGWGKAIKGHNTNRDICKKCPI